MQPWEIHLNDWYRILFGNTPPEFFIEIVLRVVFIYLLIIFCIRLMGKRMASQLSRNELVAISSLAASIGIPIQTPDRGLLPALLVALIVVAAQRLVSARLTADQRFETRSQGNISILVDDCCLQIKEMYKVKISREELFGRLREQEIKHLGMVRRLYFEAEGSFTLIPNQDGTPGLCILPEEDEEFRNQQTYLPNHLLCGNCGAPKPANEKKCPNCDHHDFTPAIS
jgi:uncharacterized membrane protein YcaP (DUF421 family)